MAPGRARPYRSVRAAVFGAILSTQRQQRKAGMAAAAARRAEPGAPPAGRTAIRSGPDDDQSRGRQPRRGARPAAAGPGFLIGLPGLSLARAVACPGCRLPGLSLARAVACPGCRLPGLSLAA